MVDISAPFGRLPVTLKVMGSLLGSSAVTVILTVVLTVKLTTVGPDKIVGGKLSNSRKQYKLSVIISTIQCNIALVQGVSLLTTRLNHHELIN